MRARTHAESWHTRRQLPTGTRAYDEHDERHVGRVDAVLWNRDHRITFDNGTRADVPQRRVRRAAEGC